MPHTKKNGRMLMEEVLDEMVDIVFFCFVVVALRWKTV
jgi:hypothetical protein